MDPVGIMKKNTVQQVKKLAREELKLPPPRIMKNKKAYNRKAKHRTGYREESGPFFIPVSRNPPDRWNSPGNPFFEKLERPEEAV